MYDVQNPDEISHQKLYTYPSHLNNVARLPCVLPLIFSTQFYFYFYFHCFEVYCASSSRRFTDFYDDDVDDTDHKFSVNKFVSLCLMLAERGDDKTKDLKATAPTADQKDKRAPATQQLLKPRLADGAGTGKLSPTPSKVEVEKVESVVSSVVLERSDVHRGVYYSEEELG